MPSLHTRASSAPRSQLDSGFRGLQDAEPLGLGEAAARLEGNAVDVSAAVAPGLLRGVGSSVVTTRRQGGLGTFTSCSRKQRLEMRGDRVHRLWQRDALQVPRKRPRRRVATSRPRPEPPGAPCGSMSIMGRPPRNIDVATWDKASARCPCPSTP